MLVLIFLLLRLVVPATAAVDFTSQVEPLFRSRCIACHGAAQQMSGLRLDGKTAAMAGGYSGKVIIPGKSVESSLMLRVTGAKGLMKMPPSGTALTSAEIGVLRQ